MTLQQFWNHLEIVLHKFKTYYISTSSEMTKVPDLFSDLLIVRQQGGPLNDVINYHHKRYLRYKFQLHTVFKTWETGGANLRCTLTIVKIVYCQRVKFIKKRGRIGSVYIVPEQNTWKALPINIWNSAVTTSQDPAMSEVWQIQTGSHYKQVRN